MAEVPAKERPSSEAKISTENPAENKAMAQQSSQDKTSPTPKAVEKAPTDKSQPRNQRRSSSISSSQSTGTNANKPPANQTRDTTQSSLPSAGGGLDSTGNRKGRRRVMANANSARRNQYPRSTSLGGLMQQGYLEQTTTSQHAYPPTIREQSTTPTPKPRFQKKIPIAEDEYVITTSRPLQHTPRNNNQLYLSPNNQAINRNSARSNKSSSIVLESARSEDEGLSMASSRQSQRSARQASTRKESSSHRMPENWTRTQPFRYADTLKFEGEHARLITRNQEDYTGNQLATPRPQSLDRKLLTSQLGDVLFGNGVVDLESERGGKNRRRNRSHDPEDYRGMFADRRVPFSYADHDIFQGVREDGNLELRTENGEAFRRPERVEKSGLAKPKNQLELFGGRDGTDTKTVTQQTFQGITIMEPLLITDILMHFSHAFLRWTTLKV